MNQWRRVQSPYDTLTLRDFHTLHTLIVEGTCSRASGGASCCARVYLLAGARECGTSWNMGPPHPRFGALGEELWARLERGISQVGYAS